jgi:DHA1 family bicyclomycin/chloramphenicol resistance-like MFS transporter
MAANMLNSSLVMRYGHDVILLAGALDHLPEVACSVSALIGAIHYGSGIIGSDIVGACADGTPWPMAWVILACGILSRFSLGFLRPESISREPMNSVLY